MEEEEKTKGLKISDFFKYFNHYNALKLFEDKVDDKVKNVRL